MNEENTEQFRSAEEAKAAAEFNRQMSEERAEQKPGEAREDVLSLGTLQWISERGKAFQNLTYEEVRGQLKLQDYEQLKPLAAQLKQEFDQNYRGTMWGKEWAEGWTKGALGQVQEQAKRMGMRMSDRGNEFAFGKGLQNREDVLRIYLSPKLSKETINGSLQRIFNLLEGLDGNAKINDADWFQKTGGTVGKQEAVRPSRDMNRVVVYLDRNSPQVTEFFRRLAADKDLLRSMEDSGEWMNLYRMPIAGGVNIVEGSYRSWDTSEGKEVVGYKTKLATGQWPQWINQPHNYLEKAQEVVKSRSLAPIGRDTNMPALKAS